MSTPPDTAPAAAASVPAPSTAPTRTRREVLLLPLAVGTWLLLLPLAPLRMAAFFPIGLWGFLVRWVEPRTEVGVALGWAVYVAVLAVYFTCRRARLFWWTFGILALLLLTNVGGCYYLNRH